VRGSNTSGTENHTNTLEQTGPSCICCHTALAVWASPKA